MTRIYHLNLFVEVDDKSLDKLTAMAKNALRASNPDIPVDELVDCPGDAVEEVSVGRMLRGRPPIKFISSSVDAYGVPMPRKKDIQTVIMSPGSLEGYYRQFLREHPPVLDEDGRHTGEFLGYAAKPN